jgi:hypothetical protein
MEGRGRGGRDNAFSWRCRKGFFILDRFFLRLDRLFDRNSLPFCVFSHIFKSGTTVLLNCMPAVGGFSCSEAGVLAPR